MENPYLIPIIVTLVTAMALGAIYLLVLLVNDGTPVSRDEDEDADDAEGDTSPHASPDPAADAGAPADSQH